MININKMMQNRLKQPSFNASCKLVKNIMASGSGKAIVNAGTSNIPHRLKCTSRIIKNSL